MQGELVKVELYYEDGRTQTKEVYSNSRRVYETTLDGMKPVKAVIHSPTFDLTFLEALYFAMAPATTKVVELYGEPV